MGLKRKRVGLQSLGSFCHSVHLSLISVVNYGKEQSPAQERRAPHSEAQKYVFRS